MVGRSDRWQLKSASDYSGNCNVLIELFPAQSITVELKLDFSKLLLARRFEPAKPVGRKAHDPTIVQLYVNGPPFNPDSDSGRLGSDWSFIGDGTH